MKFFIPSQVPSSKNSKVWTGKFLVNSPQTTRYKKETKSYWEKYVTDFHKTLEGKEKPYGIGLYFVRKDKRKFDYNNVSQIVFDLMQDYDWIDNDSAYDVVPVFLGFEVNGLNPGVYIEVL